tara:strand:+ start:875 stop:1003 length:129 start_codon:yes stop_codon:yes gene_type:complete
LPFTEGKGKMIAKIIPDKRIFKEIIYLKISRNHRGENKHADY